RLQSRLHLDRHTRNTGPPDGVEEPWGAHTQWVDSAGRYRHLGGRHRHHGIRHQPARARVQLRANRAVARSPSPTMTAVKVLNDERFHAGEFAISLAINQN